jgi:undecaprenyl pyrophosphate phosphatase UppP
MFDRLKQLFAMEDNRAQMRGADLPTIIIGLGVAIVVGFVVISIASETIEVTALSDGDPLNNASDSLENATNDLFGLMSVVFLSIVLAVVVFYLRGVRGGMGR